MVLQVAVRGEGRKTHVAGEIFDLPVHVFFVFLQSALIREGGTALPATVILYFEVNGSLVLA